MAGFGLPSPGLMLGLTAMRDRRTGLGPLFAVSLLESVFILGVSAALLDGCSEVSECPSLFVAASELLSTASLFATSLTGFVGDATCLIGDFTCWFKVVFGDCIGLLTRFGLMLGLKMVLARRATDTPLGGEEKLKSY